MHHKSNIKHHNYVNSLICFYFLSTKKRFDVVCLILFKIITNNVRNNLCDRSFHTFEWIFGPKREADVTAEAERGNELVLYFMQIIYFADFIFAALHCCRLAAMAAEVKL